MTESILSPFSAASFLSFLLDVSLKSLLILAAAGLVCLGLRRTSAASRHALWVVTVVCLLCLPAFCVLLPRWSVPVLPFSAQHHAQTPLPVGSRVEEVAPQQPLLTEPSPSDGDVKLSGQSSSTTGSAASAASAASTPSTAPALSALDVSPSPVARVMAPPVAKAKPISPTSRRAAFRPTIPQLILSIWLVGVLMVLARAFIGIMAARRLVRRCRQVSSGPLADAAEQARATLGLSYGVAVRESPPGTAVMVPMTFGLLRPVVLLPQGAAQWPAERLRVVMLHEIAHIKRRDWLTTMLAEVACALYWFHPLVWLAAHRLRTESEQACDDLVLTSGVQAVDYADHLLEVVRGLKGRHGSMPAVVTMAQERDLTGRLKMILAENRTRGTIGRRGMVVAALTAACLLAPLAALRPVSATGPTRSKGPSPHYSQTAVKPAVRNGYARMGQWQKTLLNASTSPWKATLPSGVQVCLTELWALNGPDSDKFWTPDGTVLIAAGGNGTTSYYGQFHSRVYNIDVALSFPSDALRREARVSFGKRGDHPGGGTDLAGFDRNGCFLNDRRIINTGFQRMFPPSQKKTDLVVSVATGPETTLISAPPLRGATRRLPTGEVLWVSGAAIHSKAGGIGDVASFSLTLPSRFVRDESEYKISLVGQNGQPLDVPRLSQSYPVFNRTSAAVVYSFSTTKLPISRVKELRLTYRSSQTAVFRNVTLRPVQSSSQVTPNAPLQTPPSSALPSLPPPVGDVPSSAAPPSAAPKTFDATTWAQTAGDAALKLVAVSDKPSNTKRWWQPDGTPFIYDWHKFGIRFEHNKPPYTQAFFQQWPVLIFRSGHPSNSYVTIDGWEDPHRFDANGKASSGEFFCIDQDNSRKASFTSLLAKTPRSLSVRMRVGAGPWQAQDTREMIYTPERLSNDVHQITDGDSVASWKVRPISRTQTEIIIQPAEGIKDKQVRLVAFGGHGREYAPTPSAVRSYDKGFGPQTQYTLAVPLSSIRKFVIETRPYHYLDFYGIARQPKQVPPLAGVRLINPKTTVLHVGPPANPLPANSDPATSQISDPPSSDPTVRDRASQQRIDAAMSLRQHLRGWALQHAPLLRQMRRAKPNDLAALIRVYPREPLPGRYPGDPRLQEPGEGDHLTFTGLSAPLTLSHLQHSHEAFAQGIREDFAKYRDFRLSQSINTGRSSVTLWASGRVTETTRVDQKVERGKPILTARVESRDIALPYEFLFPDSSF